MFCVIAVILSMLFAISITLASHERFADNLKKSPVLAAVLCLDAVFIVLNLILKAMSLMLLPGVYYIAAAVLVVLTVFVSLVNSTRKILMYVAAVVICGIFVFSCVCVLPEDYRVKEFDGEEYLGVAVAEYDLKNLQNYIYYYKSKSPLIISSEYDYSEYYGIRYGGSDWDAITKDGPCELNYYENGKLVRTKPIYDWIK